MKKLIIATIFLLSAITETQSFGAVSLMNSRTEPRIVVNNRVLAKVNGKPISVVDVMKKMDMLFYKQFPEYANSIEARYQFYTINWKYLLDELISKELILADAQEAKMEVTPGDVRQEMEQLFGPNIHANLDKIGLSYDEASRMVQGDLTLRRAMFMRVNVKAIRQTTPLAIRTAYEEFAKTNIRPDEWVYRVITIRDRSQVKGAEAANHAHQLLTVDKVDVAELADLLKDKNLLVPSTTVTVSEELHTSDKDMAASYKEILSQLQPNDYSNPLPQKSRDAQKVYRIFYLKELNKGGPVPFAEVENKIKDELLEEAVEKESKAYLTRLRQHFDVQESHLKDMLAEGFEPFQLQ